jgi:hypothetical protein
MKREKVAANRLLLADWLLATAVPVYAVAPRDYIVQCGDALIGIAARRGVSVSKPARQWHTLQLVALCRTAPVDPRRRAESARWSSRTTRGNLAAAGRVS